MAHFHHTHTYISIYSILALLFYFLSLSLSLLCWFPFVAQNYTDTFTIHAHTFGSFRYNHLIISVQFLYFCFVFGAIEMCCDCWWWWWRDGNDGLVCCCCYRSACFDCTCTVGQLYLDWNYIHTIHTVLNQFQAQFCDVFFTSGLSLLLLCDSIKVRT